MAENPEEPTFDLSDPATKARFDAYADEVAKGLKANEAKLKSEKQAEAKARRDAEQRHQELLESLGGEDGISALKNLREKFEAQEDADLVKKGDIDALIGKRVKVAQKDFDAEKAKLLKQIEAATKKTEDEAREKAAVHAKLAAYRRESLVRQIWASHDEFQAEAANDAVVLVERRLAYDAASDDFHVLDEFGSPMEGKDGKPVTPEDLVMELAEKRPYWFKPSAGGGAQGSRGKAGAKTTKADLARTPGARLDFIRKHGQEAYGKLPEK